jgi:cytochrome c oxidase cbb3-type subunit 3
MSSFWSGWIIVLTSFSIIAITWLLFANRSTDAAENDTKTEHVYDGIEEYDNPLPAWWFYMFVISIVFSIGYLIAYPGMGNFKGLLNWTSVGQWQQEVDAAEEKFSPLYQRYAETPVIELAQDNDARKMGKRLYANNCSLCHGSDARGAFGFPDLTDNDWLYGGSPEQIKHSISSGRTGMMPPWGQIIDQAGLENVTAYVQSLSVAQDSSDSTSSADLTAGKQVYSMYCANCHADDGTGNQMLGAPNLSDGIWLYGGSKGQILQTISAGRTGKMPAHNELISDEKIHVLTAYIYGLSHQ